jgi:hypothetical protein
MGRHKPVFVSADLHGQAIDRDDDPEADLIDWDVKIDDPPPRPSETLTVRFVDGGRRSLPM